MTAVNELLQEVVVRWSKRWMNATRDQIEEM
jgi:hypothetical protein